MITFNLFRLVDQAGDISGEKVLVGSFATLALAKAAGLLLGCAHYSIENSNDYVGEDTVVFIV